MSFPKIPFLQGTLEAFFGLLFVDLLEVFMDMISFHGLQVESWDGLYNT
ncbi:MAG: hypothetical protein KBG82_06290 [Spirochaetes bacterium]|nr:hypothetical protein [Spirochaetota bacterium]